MANHFVLKTIRFDVVTSLSHIVEKRNMSFPLKNAKITPLVDNHFNHLYVSIYFVELAKAVASSKIRTPNQGFKETIY